MNLKQVSACLAVAIVCCVTTAPASAQLDGDDIVDFGPQTMGTATAPRTLTVVNDLGFPFTLHPLQLGGTDAGSFRIERDGCSGALIDLSGACDFDVVFQPQPRLRTASDPYGSDRSAELVIGDDSGEPPFVVQLRGQALRPQTLTNLSRRTTDMGFPFDQDFGAVAQGQRSPVRRIRFASSGGSLEVVGAVVGQAAILGEGAANFTIVGDSCSKRQLPRSGTCEIGVGFAPHSSGDQEATLAVPGGGRRALTIPLHGSGAPPVAVGLRRVARATAAFVARNPLRFGRGGRLSLGHQRWLADGKVVTTLSLLGPRGRKRRLAISPEAAVSVDDVTSLAVRLRRGGRRLLSSAGRRPRLLLRIELTHDGVRVVAGKRFRASNPR